MRIKTAIAGHLPASGRAGLVVLLSISGILIYKPPPYDLLLAALMLWWFLKKGFVQLRVNRLASISLTLYVCLYGVSVMVGEVYQTALWYFGLTVFCAAMWIFFTSLFQTYGASGYHAVMLGHVITSVIGVAFSFVVFLSNMPGRDALLYNGRPKGMYVDANVFGPSLVLACVYALGETLQSRGRRRVRLMWTLASATCAAGILVTFSRGAWINLAISSTTFAVLLISRRSRRHRFGLPALLVAEFAILCLVGLYILNNNEQISETVSSRLGLQKYDQDRFASQRNALEVAMANPFLGMGPGQYIPAFEIAPHNLYLHIMVENGFPAITAFGLFLLSSLVAGLHRFRRASLEQDRIRCAVVSAVLLGTLINSFVIDSLHWRHLWLLLAAVWVPMRQGSGVRISTATRTIDAKDTKWGAILPALNDAVPRVGHGVTAGRH